MNLAIYKLLLCLYPREFRDRWQDEMLETFQAQIADGWWDTWSTIVPELLAVTREELTIPFVSLAGSGTILCGLVWAMGNSPVLNALYHRLITKLGG